MKDSLRHLRDERVWRLRDEIGLTVRQIAKIEEISEKQIYNILQRLCDHRDARNALGTNRMDCDTCGKRGVDF